MGWLALVWGGLLAYYGFTGDEFDAKHIAMVVFGGVLVLIGLVVNYFEEKDDK